MYFKPHLRFAEKGKPLATQIACIGIAKVLILGVEIYIAAEFKLIIPEAPSPIQGVKKIMTWFFKGIISVG